MASQRLALLGLCAATLLPRVSHASRADLHRLDEVGLAQVDVRLVRTRQATAFTARAETAEGSASGEVQLWLPSLTQVIVPVVVVGVALVIGSTFCGCRAQKGCCCYISGCCGGTLVMLAICLIVAKVVLAKMAGPAPAGPTPAETATTNVEVKAQVPFTAAQINAPGPIREAYKKGMQVALDNAPGAIKGALVVVGVEANPTNSRVSMLQVTKETHFVSNLRRSSDGLLGGQQQKRLLAKAQPRMDCVDSPESWISSTGYSCDDYAKHSWCTSDGKPGSGWGKTWGTLEDYASGANLTAITACCACGGGFEAYSHNDIVLVYSLEPGKDLTTQQMTNPAVSKESLNAGVREAATMINNGNAGTLPKGLQDVATGGTEALSSGTVEVATTATIRCHASHNLNHDLQQAARIVLKKKMNEVEKAVEDAATEGLHGFALQLADRCNDPSQAEAMRVCVGDSTVWADLLAPDVKVSAQETSVEAFLCEIGCKVKKALKTHKKEALKMVDDQVAGFSVDENLVHGIGCSPILGDNKQCDPCE